MEPVSFTSRLAARDVMRVSTRLLLRHNISILAMAVGPVFWLVGLAGSSEQVTRLGLSLMPLLVAVPGLAFLVGSLSAYRPGTSELYEPVEWTFADESIEIRHPGRSARAEWEEFRSWRFAGGCYVLHTTRTHYLLVPARDVGDERRVAFEELLTSHLGPKHR